MSRTSARLASMPRSGIRTVLERALRTPGVVRLEVGDPDFGTPPHIVEAAARAAAEGFTHYTPSAGLPELRALIREKVADRNDLHCTVEQTVVTTGACGGLFATFLALLDFGDEVLVPDPGWTVYPSMIQSLGGVVTRYRLDPAAGFAPDLDEIESLVGPRSRAIVVNSPGNPTGAVFGRDTIERIIEIAGRHDLWVISDEAYDEIYFEEAPPSTAAVGEPDRVVTVFTFSKTYAMTGWRIGYAIAPPDIAPAIARAQESMVSNVSSVSQKAAEAALTGPQQPVLAMREAYRERRDAAMEILDRAAVGYVRPRGAFYLMIDVARQGAPAAAFAERLLDDYGVAVVPGSAFGAAGEGMVRVSACVDEETLRIGAERLVGALADTASSEEAVRR